MVRRVVSEDELGDPHVMRVSRLLTPRLRTVWRASLGLHVETPLGAKSTVPAPAPSIEVPGRRVNLGPVARHGRMSFGASEVILSPTTVVSMIHEWVAQAGGHPGPLTSMGDHGRR